MSDPGPAAPGGRGQAGMVEEPTRRDELERLREALRELRVREEQLRLVTDALPVLVSFVDANQRYRFVSAAYERWFGHAKDAVLGKRLEEVLGEEAYRAVLPHAERALAGSAVRYEAEVPYRDGGRRFIEATYLPQRAGDGSVAGFVGLVADITERKALERYRAEAAARAGRLLKITAAIADAVSAEDVFTALVDHVAEAVGASSAALWLVDDDDKSATLVRARGYPEAAERRFSSVPLETTPGIPATDSIRSGEPIWIPSKLALLERYPHLRSVTTEGRAYRISCLPLLAHGRVLGALALTIEGETEVTEDERDFLLLVARYASQAVERLRLFEAERKSRAQADAAAMRLGVLSRASRAFVDSEMGLESRLRAVVSHLATALDSCIDIALLESDGHLHLTAVEHPIPEARALLPKLSSAAPLRVGEGVAGTIAATGESVLLPHIDHEMMAARAAPSYPAFLERFPAYAMIGAPLRVRARVIGTVTATRCRPGETYTSDDLRLLEELADRAAIAIENGAAVAKLEDTIRSNELFAGVLGHDLRNPLGAILISAQQVLARPEGPAASGALNRIVASGERMTKMIDQLLDFTRARSGGGIDVEARPANMADLCAQAVNELELAHPQWKIHRQVAGEQNGTWDPERLVQVISNLVANAGQHGSRSAGIAVTLDGTRPDSVELRVHNEGAIPEALVPHLFDPFRRSRFGRDQSRGLGLGLYIVREIVRAHGGSVEVVSSEAAGTTFTIALPRHAAHASTPSDRAGSAGA